MSPRPGNSTIGLGLERDLREGLPRGRPTVLWQTWSPKGAEAIHCGGPRKEKGNKLCAPLNIHDSSFAEANGKHINPFTTLLNAKKMDEGHSVLWGKLGGT